MKNSDKLELVQIPNFGGDYLISKCGRVFSNKSELKEMMQFGSPDNPRVCLWKNNSRYRPLVRTLLDRTFGSSKHKPAVTDNFLSWYLSEQYKLDPDEIKNIVNRPL